MLRHKTFPVIALVLLVILAGVLVIPNLQGTSGADTFQPSWTLPVSESERAQTVHISASDVAIAGNSFNQVYANVSPSVVAISVFVPQQNGQLGFGSGSGFVIDKAGHIVTNNHVVNDATRIEVEFFDGTLVEAQVVGNDIDSDLAVIKVDLPEAKLFPVTFANSDEVVVGDSVMAIGSPFGQRWTLTTGIISALDRTIQSEGQFSIGGVIQTDTPINPGNSGGPLLDIQGRVIGVNSQILSQSGTNSGVGFAIPSNLTQRVAYELIQDGTVDYSYIGISGGDVSLALIQSLGIANDVRGVVVNQVVDNGPAARSGLRSASGREIIDGIAVPSQVDIITAINGLSLRGMNELISYLAQDTRPGDTATLTVLRNGSEQLEIDVILGSR